MRKIPFIFGDKASAIPFVYGNSNRLNGFAFQMGDDVRKITLPISKPDKVRKLLMDFGVRALNIGFPLSIPKSVPAILGVLDPYALGDLDEMSIDFRMYDGINELVFSEELGASGENIFAKELPLSYPFSYRVNPYAFPFNVGKYFMDIWYMGTKPVYLYLYSTNNGCKAEPTIEKWFEHTTGKLYLVNGHTDVVSHVLAEFKDVLGFPHTLGETDTYTLGGLDPILMFSMDRRIANMMKLGGIMSAVGEVTMDTEEQTLYLGAKTSKDVLSDVVVTPAVKMDGLSSVGAIRDATLGDLDIYELTTIDYRKLNMRIFGKAQLNVITD